MRKQHPDFPALELTKQGAVYKNGKLAKLTKRYDGYLVVGTGGRGMPTRRVHCLVMETFVGPRPAGLEVRHLDGVRDHNNLSNLKYGTPLEQHQDRLRHGTHVNPPPQPGAMNFFYEGKMDSVEMRLAVTAYTSGELTQRKAAAKYGVTRSGMRRVMDNDAAKEVGSHD